jgi:hypothetical protein
LDDEKTRKLDGYRTTLFPGYPRGLSFGTMVGSRSPEGRADWFRYWENSVPVPSETTEILGEAARQAGVYLVIGVIERDVEYGVINVFDLQKKEFRKMNLKTLLNNSWKGYPTTYQVPPLDSNPTAFKREPSPEELRAEVDKVLKGKGLSSALAAVDDLFSDGVTEISFEEEKPKEVSLDDLF